MKKKYLEPYMLVTNIQVQSVIALSELTGDADENGEVLTRKRNTYDDEEVEALFNEDTNAWDGGLW